jgi:hypothetical protein
MLFFAPGLATAQTPDPAGMAGKDAHDGVTIACAPILDAVQSKARFGKKHPVDGGVLAVELFVRNDNSEAVKMDVETIRLVVNSGSSRQRLRTLRLDEVAHLIIYKDGVEPKTTRKRLPGPVQLPGGKKSKEVEKLEAMLRPLALEMDVIPPRATVKGFLFFDMGALFELARNAQLYIPDLTFTQSGKALLYFEIELAAAAK